MDRKESEKFLREIFNVDITGLNNIYRFSEVIVKLLISSKNPELIYISPNVQQILGFTADLILSKSDGFTSLISKEERKKYLEQLNSFINDKSKNRVEFSPYRLCTNRDETIWVKEIVVKITVRNTTVLLSEIKNFEEEIYLQKTQEIISEVTKIFINIKEIDEIFSYLKHIFSKIITVNNFYVAKIEDDEYLNFILFYDGKDKHPGKRKFTKGLTEYLISENSELFLTKEQIVNLNDVGKIELIGELPEFWAGIPLIVENKIWGVIVIQRYENDTPFSEAEKRLLRFVADRIAFAITNVSRRISLQRREEEVSRKADFFRALHRISNLTSNLNRLLDEVLEEVINVLSNTLGVEYWVKIKNNGSEYVTNNYVGKNQLFIQKIDTPDGIVSFLEVGKLKKSSHSLNKFQYDLLNETVNKIKDYYYRKNAARVIFESEYKFRSIIQFAPVAILITDETGSIVNENNSATRMFNYNSNEFKKLNINNIINVSNKKQSLTEYFTEVEEESELANIEITCKRKNGEEFFAEYSLASWILKQKRFFAFFISDISQRKETERKLKYSSEFEKVISNISSVFLNKGLSKFPEAFEYALSKVGIFFNAIRSSYFVIDKSKKNINCIYEWAKSNDISLLQDSQNLSIRSFSSALNKLTKNNTLIINKLTADKLQKKILSLRNAESAVLVTSYVSRVFAGFFMLEFAHQNLQMDDEILVLLGLYSEVLSNAYLQFIEAKEKEKATLMMSKFLHAVEQSASSIVITDINGDIEYVNPAFEKITHYSKEEVIGKNPRILKSGYTKDEEYKKLWDLISSGKTWKGMFKNRRKDGTFFWESAIISPVKDSRNQIVNYIAIKEDITEKLKLENQRALSSKMEAIGELAAGIAHEINTPMQFINDNTTFIKESFESIISFIQELNEKIENDTEITIEDFREFIKNSEEEYDFQFLIEEVPAAIEQTLEGIDRVSKIVKAVKEFSHASTKEKVLVDLNKSVESAVMISRNEWKYVAEMELNLDKNLPSLYCLIDEINQVLLNIIVNAAQAIAEKLGERPAEKGKIIITTTFDEKFAEVKISDTGIGIPEENLHKIFDPFFTTKEVGKGTGQGLAITHDIIVNKHNGTLEVESEVGKGSTFIIKLPLAQK